MDVGIMLISELSILLKLFYDHYVKSVLIWRVFLVRIFPHWEWKERDTPYFSVFSPNAGNTDQKNSEYGHFLRLRYDHISR